MHIHKSLMCTYFLAFSIAAPIDPPIAQATSDDVAVAKHAASVVSQLDALHGINAANLNGEVSTMASKALEIVAQRIHLDPREFESFVASVTEALNKISRADFPFPEQDHLDTLAAQLAAQLADFPAPNDHQQQKHYMTKAVADGRPESRASIEHENSLNEEPETHLKAARSVYKREEMHKWEVLVGSQSRDLHKRERTKSDTVIFVVVGVLDIASFTFMNISLWWECRRARRRKAAEAAALDTEEASDTVYHLPDVPDSSHASELLGTCAQCGSDVHSTTEFVSCCGQVFHSSCVGQDTECLGHSPSCIGMVASPPYQKPPTNDEAAS